MRCLGTIDATFPRLLARVASLADGHQKELAADAVTVVGQLYGPGRHRVSRREVVPRDTGMQNNRSEVFDTHNYVQLIFHIDVFEFIDFNRDGCL